MPVIPADSGDWGELSGKAARLLMNPYDLAATRELDDCVQGNALFTLLKLLGPEKVELTLGELTMVHKADRLGVLIAASEQNINRAMIAGRVLLCALRLAHYVPDRASVANAIKLVGHALETEGSGGSRSTLM